MIETKRLRRMCRGTPVSLNRIVRCWVFAEVKCLSTANATVEI
jgi:hypothetical protein